MKYIDKSDKWLSPGKANTNDGVTLLSTMPWPNSFPECFRRRLEMVEETSFSVFTRKPLSINRGYGLLLFDVVINGTLAFLMMCSTTFLLLVKLILLRTCKFLHVACTKLNLSSKLLNCERTHRAWRSPQLHLSINVTSARPPSLAGGTPRVAILSVMKFTQVERTFTQVKCTWNPTISNIKNFTFTNCPDLCNCLRGILV